MASSTREVSGSTVCSTLAMRLARSSMPVSTFSSLAACPSAPFFSSPIDENDALSLPSNCFISGREANFVVSRSSACAKALTKCVSHTATLSPNRSTSSLVCSCIDSSLAPSASMCVRSGSTTASLLLLISSIRRAMSARASVCCSMRSSTFSRAPTMRAMLPSNDMDCGPGPLDITTFSCCANRSSMSSRRFTSPS